MFRKLLIAYLVLLAFALGTLGVLFGQSIRKRVRDEIALRLESQAEMLRPLVQAVPSSELQATVRELGGRVGSRLTVIGPDGVVMADSHANPSEMDNHNARPEVQGSRAEGRGRNVRHSDTVRHDMMYCALRLAGNQADGVVLRAAFPLTQIQAEIRALYRGIVLAFFVTALVGVVVTYLAVRQITRPLSRIRAVAQAISAGDFSQKAPLEASEEIASVGLAINRMAEELSGRLDSLKAERSRLEALIASMAEGVIALDREGRVSHCNRAAEGLFGIRHPLTGMKLWDALRLTSLREKVEPVLQTGEPARTHFEVGSRIVAACIYPIREQQGAVLVAHDATEERRYDALRKEFVANVSHELRTPLSLIRGYVETLREGAWKDAQRAPEFLETVDKNVQRLCAIVADLLDLSKLDSAGEIAKLKPIDVGPFLEKVRETFQPLAAKKQQTLVVELNPKDITVEADPDLLERAIGNLVDNAIKYTPDEGTVRLRASAAPEAVLLVVEDNGVGIPEKDIPRIFERFYRVDKSRSREMGGTGLGLAIVKHVAQLHGGAVSVQSRVGYGSTFTLRLPPGSDHKTA